MLAVSKDTASAGVVHKSIAIKDVPKKCLQVVDGPEVNLDSKLCVSVPRPAYENFLCVT